MDNWFLYDPIIKNYLDDEAFEWDSFMFMSLGVDYSFLNKFAILRLGGEL